MRVGIAGLGTMGSGSVLAARLAETGCDLQVCKRMPLPNSRPSDPPVQLTEPHS